MPIFKKLNVTLIIRLNEPKYDSTIFIKNGINHLSLEFEDGSTPPDSIVDKFFKNVENTKGAVAIHCKSGLGRTGTLIGLYAMKHYKMKAD